jgi:hypothetical protein
MHHKAFCAIHYVLLVSLRVHYEKPTVVQKSAPQWHLTLAAGHCTEVLPLGNQGERNMGTENINATLTLTYLSHFLRPRGRVTVLWPSHQSDPCKSAVDQQ